MRYRVLGPLEVANGERAVPLGSGRQRHLLAVLLVHAGRVVSTDQLVDLLWGGSPPGPRSPNCTGWCPGCVGCWARAGPRC